MNFRLPFQISRVSSICQSSSPVNLISKFTPLYGNYVKNQKKHKPNNSYHTWIISNKCEHKTFHPTFNSQQKFFIHDIADTEQAVKERVRKEQNCDCEIYEEPELAFRQTTKLECCKCVDCKPCVAPPLLRPPKFYDDSKCLYNHECKPDFCNIKPPRMDNIYCCPVKNMKLPNLPTADCRLCMDIMKKPLLAPPLFPPKKYYDPNQMKWNHKNCTPHRCVRMDDVCGYKVQPKELPTIPTKNKCNPCLVILPLTTPKLLRPVLRYDPTCIPYPHTNCPDNDDPTRRDSLCCEPICRELPPMPCSDCLPCQEYMPTVCPKLGRPSARYDSTEMKYKHECIQSPCDTPSLRSDNNNDIISVTLTRKKLPRIPCDNTCKPCSQYHPLIAPELKPPRLHNCNLKQEQNREHCIEEKPIRRDGNIKIHRQCLPPVPISDCCKPCYDAFEPCTTPHFAPIQKLYDDTCCKYRHECVIEPCHNPLRMDDLCYKVIEKELPKVPNSPDCRPCVYYPKTAPRLGRPFKKYDDSNHKYRHEKCPEDPCKVIPRADNITGITDTVKELQTYKALKCKPCQQYFPCTAPELTRPHPRYDSTCMLYDHKNCPPPCDGSEYRRDHYLCEGPKRLPKFKYGTICCEPCQLSYPTTAPCLKPPKKLYEFPYDPARVKECPPECPPRRDDLLCWRPRRKKLPSFKDCDQCCCYSTLSWSKNVQYLINSNCQLEKKIKTNFKRNFSTVHVSNKLQGKEKSSRSKKVLEPSKTQQKQIENIKTNDVSRYYLLEKPTWKSIDNPKVAENDTTPKKYDYSIEKWLREGAEQIEKVKLKSNLYKKSRKREYNNLDIHTKLTNESDCITPAKFTGYDNSGCNEYLCIKKNNILQPLRIGTYKSDQSFETCVNTYNKRHDKSTMCVSRDISIKEITSTFVSKEENKHFTLTNIIQERIKPHISSFKGKQTSNFVLNLNNKMRSTLFQKISNFFKKRENAAKDRKFLKASKHESKIIIERKNNDFMAKICEKYDIKVNASKLKMERNKPYIVKKTKNNQDWIKVNKYDMCCSSNSAKKEEKNNLKSLSKNMKLKLDHVRSFSTNSKTGPLNYKHIDISDDYIGKIYKVKLKKIGVKNLMLEKNDPDKRDEEPHTICYICKVVPRFQPIVHDDPPDIENVKINYYKEKRNTIE